MKILTKEQEQAHYNATLQGGILGGFGGLAVGALGVIGASRRYQFFRQLTLPLKTFLVTSSGTFAGIISADHYSRAFEQANNPKDVEFQERKKQKAEAAAANKTFTEKAMDFGKKERYKIVGGSWIASMFAAFSIVNRNKYLTGQQKLVQARVYAQFLTLGVLVATAAFEISDQRNNEGRYETVKVVDPHDPEHKRMINQSRAVQDDAGDSLWKDMVAAEEARIKEREEEENRLRTRQQKKQTANGKSPKNHSGAKPHQSEDNDTKSESGDKKQEEGDAKDAKGAEEQPTKAADKKDKK